VRAFHLALAGQRGLGCRLGPLQHLLRHDQRTQLGVGRQYTVKAVESIPLGELNRIADRHEAGVSATEAAVVAGA